MLLVHYMPAYRGECKYDAAISMAEVGRTLQRLAIKWKPITSSGWLDDGRNQALMTAIWDEADWLLMQDADVAFDGSQIETLIEALRKEQAATIGVPVARRRRDGKDNVAQDGSIGTGLMLIDVKQVSTLKPPWFERYRNESGTRTSIGEDISFCRLLKSAGMKVAICDRITTRHHAETVLETRKRPERGYTLTKTPLEAVTPGTGNGSHKPAEVP